MSDVLDLHRLAMDIAERAFLARFAGDSASADDLLRQAFEYERRAAESANQAGSEEPTRSVLLRSAASLAADCKEFREAERLVAVALSGDPPSDIAEELRDLLEDVQFGRHLALRGTELREANEFQLSMAGQAVGRGVVLYQEFLSRLDNTTKLIVRTAERLAGVPYRERGQVGKPVGDVSVFISVPRPASFAVTLKVARSQLCMPDVSDSVSGSAIIDELLNCLRTFNDSGEAAVAAAIAEEPYRRNFVGLAKQLAPDGRNITGVGFTAVRAGCETRVALTRRRDTAAGAGTRQPTSAPEQHVRIIGSLRLADATHSTDEICLVPDGDRKSQRISVPEGMMSDVVKPFWGERVQVDGIRKKSAIILTDIRLAQDEPTPRPE